MSVENLEALNQARYLLRGHADIDVTIDDESGYLIIDGTFLVSTPGERMITVVHLDDDCEILKATLGDDVCGPWPSLHAQYWRELVVATVRAHG